VKKEIVADKPAVHKIMDAAAPLFAQKGFAAVSVKEIAEVAEVNIALISYYFGGKENLYAAILEAQFELVDNIIVLIRNEENCPIEKIRRFSQAVVKLHKSYPYIHRLIYGEIINATNCYESIVKPGIIRTRSFLAECILAGMNSGQIRPDIKPDCANLLLDSVLHFYFISNHLVDEFLEQKEDKAEYYMAEAVEMYLKGILNNSM
jgi:TetR/AcrR family transcriptional regulator